MSERPTKKQRKSLAHKERGKAKRAAMLKAMDFETNAVPNQDLEEVGDDDDEKVTPMAEHEDKRTLPGPESSRSSSKRKRDENDDISSSPAQAILPDSSGNAAKSAKKRKTDSAPVTTTVDSNKADKSKSTRRYILFVGNISYKTDPEAIAKHFTINPSASSDPSSNPIDVKPPQVRMLTSKAKSKGKSDTSKG
ncbi:hypothetical protein FRB90_002589, partial [Tulasnella sp. 427]